MVVPVITHRFNSTKPQGTDPTRIYGTAWNDTHVITGLENVQNVDTTNASNLTSGTVPAARLPNFTGPITSVGNATSVASQTGTGSKFVMDTSPTLVTPNLGTPSAAVLTNATGTASGLTAGNVTTNANLTGDVTSVGNATTLTNAPVIAKVLTGFTGGAGTVTAADSILSAIQKVSGNDALKLPLAGGTMSGAIAMGGNAITNAGAIASTAHTITSASATALAVGLNGATNPALQVDASTALQAAGIKVTGAPTGGTVSITAIDSGSNTSVSLNAKGTGNVNIGSALNTQVQVAPPLLLGAATLFNGKLSFATVSSSTAASIATVGYTSPLTIDASTITIGSLGFGPTNIYNSGTAPTGTGAYVRAVSPSVNGLSDFGTTSLTTLNVSGTFSAYNATVSSSISTVDVAQNWSAVNPLNLLATYTGYSDSARLIVRRANGTIASPAQVMSADTLGNVQFRGFPLTGGFAASGNAAQIVANAAENFTSTQQGTHLQFVNTLTGSLTTQVGFKLWGSGGVSALANTDPGAGVFGVYGNVVLTPAASATPATNGQLTFQATSNTSLTFKYKGSDGVVRSASLTLA